MDFWEATLNIGQELFSNPKAHDENLSGNQWFRKY